MVRASLFQAGWGNFTSGAAAHRTATLPHHHLAEIVLANYQLAPMDEASHPHPLSHGPNSHSPAGHHVRGGPNPRGGGSIGGGGDGGGGGFNFQNEIMWIKQDAAQVRNAVILLEQEKDSLRKAIRKLKLENGRVKLKLKSLQETVAKLTGDTKEDGEANGPSEADLDYDDIGRDFFLIGGIHDPLSLRFEVAIRDANGVEHKSAERYYWYKMAETFDDKEAMKRIHQAPNVNAAEEAMKEIKSFNEKEWDKLKLRFWEEGQRMKMEQVRWIANLLVYSRTTYLAVASQDKCFGTGWRKNREESNKPIFWDGVNEGGKLLMRIRQELKTKHNWAGPYEEEETAKKFRECQRFVWRRLDPSKRLIMSGGGGGMGRGGGVGPVHYGRGGGRGGIRGGRGGYYNGAGGRYGVGGPGPRA